MPESMTPFPKIVRPSEFTIDNSKAVSTSTTIAEPASESEIAKESEGWGYTNPNLHRRIVDKQDRAAARTETSNYYTISSNVIDISKGHTLVLPIQLGIAVHITSCVYDGQELVKDVDYSLEYSNHSVAITLLPSSSILPAELEGNKTLVINFVKYYYNDYTLAIQDVNSYRTTTTYVHDEDETYQTARPEIP